jgi:hypothetical protein
VANNFIFFSLFLVEGVGCTAVLATFGGRSKGVGERAIWINLAQIPDGIFETIVGGLAEGVTHHGVAERKAVGYANLTQPYALGSAESLEEPSTTLAESVCSGVFQGFVFGSMDTVETAAEG